jgi:hypothetical protein
MNPGYEVLRRNECEDYFICCMNTGNLISLPHADGFTLNSAESDFFIAHA